MSAAPSPAASHPQQSKPRQKPLTMGITAGAEDAKYQAKYKELKRKVKDIEFDNEKLQIQVLQAKLTVRRMKMERAIIYERLSTLPPSPNLPDRFPLPPIPTGNGSLPPPLGHGYGHIHQHPQRIAPGGGGGHREPRDHPLPMELDHSGNGGSSLSNNTNNPEHIRTHTFPSSLRGPGTGDARANINAGMDHHHPRPLTGEHDNSLATSSPHTLIHSPPRKIPSALGHHHPQHLPPQAIPPVHQYGPESHTHNSPPLPIRHSSSAPGGTGGSHSSPGIQSHSGGHPPTKPYRGNGVSGSNSNSGSNHGSGPGSATVTGQHPQIQYPESLTPVKQPLHSPPLSERERERERVGRQSHQHQHQNQHGQHHHHVHHVHQPHHSPHPHPYEYSHVGDPTVAAHSYERHMSSSTEGGRVMTTGGSSGRMHAHSRVPYDYPPQEGNKRDRDRDRDKEKDRGLDRSTEWERERERAREYSRGELTNYSPHRTRSSGHPHEYNNKNNYSSRARGAVSVATTTVAAAHHPLPAAPTSYAHGPPPPDSHHPSNMELADGPQPYFSRAASPTSGSGFIGGPGGYGHGTGGVPEGTSDTRDREWDRGRSQRVRLISRANAGAPDGESGGQAPAVSAATVSSSNGNNPPIDPSVVETGKKRSRTEMEVDGEVEGEVEIENEKEGDGDVVSGHVGNRTQSNGAAAAAAGLMPVQAQDESLRGPTAKRYHREVDSPDGH